MKLCNETDGARFLSGEMSALEIDSFEEHLETCEVCRQRLESDAGEPATWDTARELLAYGGKELKASDSRADSDWLPDCTTAQVLSFVAPSDDPAMVGRIGPYEISGLLGRGSAGIVLKGFDRALSRNVAIKILDPAISGVGAARARFAREAQAMAAISHEHLVPVFEVNEHAGLPYFVMEYVPGGSLERRLRQDGPLEVLSIVRIGQQVALALAAAHRHGLVHRDIKPGNILLDRGTERVRVADFGLVRVANDASCSRSGIVAGTPQYMAPEQVRGEVCDGQSDLFSLGAVMYALCTGHPPFRADTVYGVMQRIAHAEPRSIREQNSSVPAWLEAFILRLLAKERSARLASADTVAEILSQELAHLQNPGQVAPPRRQWLRSLAKPAGRRLGRAIAISLVAVGLLLSVGIAARMPLLTSNIGQKPASESPGTGNTGLPTVPLWDNDGTVELHSAIGTLERDWSKRDSMENDVWSLESRNLGRKLDLLLATEAEDPGPEASSVINGNVIPN